MGQAVPVSQQDSILLRCYELRNRNMEQNTPAQGNGKCFFESSVQAHFAAAGASPDILSKTSSILSRPITDTSIVSPSGFFRIHYNNLTGTPAYSVTEFAKALDSSYRFEVGFLGYPAPPKDGTNGGDDKYDVYLTPQGNFYGSTEIDYELSSGSQTFVTYILVNNDFSGFFTKGIDAARVTAAHEFHHAIQIGNYILRLKGSEITDLFFYELTSTSMEEFVYPTVNDYVNYLKEFFHNPGNAFANNSGYDIPIWNFHLRQRYGFDLIKRQWELFKTNRAMLAIANSLLEKKASFSNEISVFANKCFYTNYRCRIKKYFDDADLYPELSFMTSNLPNSGPKQMLLNVYPTSIVPLMVINSNVSPVDTIQMIITNGDTRRGIDSLSVLLPVQILISLDSIPGISKINNRYYVKITTTDYSVWNTSIYINNILFSTTTDTSSTDTSIIKDTSTTGLNFNLIPYPNPFIINQSKIIVFPVQFWGTNEEIELSIFDLRMNLIFQASRKLSLIAGKYCLSWDPIREKRVSSLGSGVYFYYIKSSQTQLSGKIVIINK